VLARVAAAGGIPTPVLQPDEKLGPPLQIAPAFLPDGRHFIYASTVPGAGVRGIYRVSLDSPDSTLLLPNASSNTAYADGYLLFLRDSTLFAQVFDPDTLKLGGDAVPIAEDIQINPTTGTGAFTVSKTGVLAYQTSTGGGGTTLAWFDGKGQKVSALAEQSGYLDVELSHAGTRASCHAWRKAGAVQTYTSTTSSGSFRRR
jgi:hypothetical protein